ncbi:DUF3043 domain-containing protein [Brachybacterium sp. JHP9]|uniref:DUF3043 domain-containing protein n=1 Tax=Brachybacterium equifaecis TaxID=2910770 RepID=A0ABT0R3K8_9MICO|nr:DUF3043 domain-containing protein [Brachybacterium equifaecis]
MSPRNSTPEQTEPVRTGSSAAPSPASTPGKGRPTRSRREAEAANRRPIVVADRKEARRRDRARASEERQAAQQAMVTGDESAMPAQHRGPERRFVRDVVDSRRNVADYFFPIAFIVLILGLVLPLILPRLATAMSFAMLVVLWGAILLCVIDSFLLRRRLRAALTERFGAVGTGLPGYGVMRSLQFRRFRLPRPQVRHGEQPR